MLSNELVRGLFGFVTGAMDMFQDLKTRAQAICKHLANDYTKEDREIALGLAFSRWQGEELAELVLALEFPREQRMFVKKAGLRLRDSSSSKERELLKRVLKTLKQRYPDLTSDVTEALALVEQPQVALAVPA